MVKKREIMKYWTNKTPLLLSLNDLSLSADKFYDQRIVYDQRDRRKFYKKTKVNSSWNSQRKLRPGRIGEWCRNVLNRK